ncbi:hypothetical protein [Streptomyces sp. S.PB5]|uniref:hypothetical protein n=1 Tax=Streptomyces sp. S.PB5 TaxID=3020844 RepID=UPI0025AF305D|nr:hypothetical protein [Streptomyces sp. S.PB5]MDN3024608.1 hypothetical protein [Streptomyces sp. S.PB5]
MSATERDETAPRTASAVSAVPMRDLLAACAAANAISTPPRVPDRETLQPHGTEQRRAA